MTAIKYLSEKSLQRAYENASKKQRDWMILKILAHTGLRASELCDLKVKNVYIAEKYLYIIGKGGFIRSVDISTDVANLLQLWINQKTLSRNDSVFNISYQSVYRMCRLHAGFKPHAFRHTYAINLLRATGNIRYLQKQLGHKNLNNTQIYLQYIDYEQEKAKLDKLYNDDISSSSVALKFTKEFKTDAPKPQHRDLTKTSSAVQKALKNGKLKKPSVCQNCGSDDHIEGHHPSYADGDELIVFWLCRKCHKALHRSLRND